ncbi:hypothetical protein PCH_Pc12g08480 [Penicillium rubens Wisconsin 54-1255]|uniref:Uncharacterized protein n=1 Tax=Penicillium rubens (strain ATCC 28089 / DSM 1075 / NRRL 1951 / Wisconsin 54-1255) TaxID=500485 RepID=B6GY95_PENRW|nr:hypothetical protein PCH_Pc12g08480 [Penicillium rubens Wisconsin 54-1255]
MSLNDAWEGDVVLSGHPSNRQRRCCRGVRACAVSGLTREQTGQDIRLKPLLIHQFPKSRQGWGGGGGDHSLRFVHSKVGYKDDEMNGAGCWTLLELENNWFGYSKKVLRLLGVNGL